MTTLEELEVTNLNVFNLDVEQTLENMYRFFNCIVDSDYFQNK